MRNNSLQPAAPHKHTRATRRNPTPVSSAPELYGTVRVILPLAAPPSDMRCISKKSDPNEFGSDRWRHHPDSDRSIRILQTLALPLGYGAILQIGAVDETRTRDLHLGKVALYQLSYYRIRYALGRSRTTDTQIFSLLLYQLSYQGIWRPGRGSNPRPPA